MAGFAVLIHPELPDSEGEQNFQALLNLTASYKEFQIPTTRAIGSFCIAAKLDTPSSLHSGIIRDTQTESWLIACGTVVALTGNNDPQILLQNLLRKYLEIGSKALEQYDGHFALVIFDSQNECLNIITDPMGHFSVFYATQGHQTLISTSALAISSLIKSEPDILSIESFLRSGIIHGDRTLWKEVKRILPATIHTFLRDKSTVFEYWAPAYDEKIAKLSINDAIAYADEMVRGMIDRILRREGKVWADLTGGFDSRVTTMYMAKSGIPFTTYSVGPDNHPDVRIPKRICQEMGWQYEQISLPNDWEETQFDWFQTALGKGDAQLSVPNLATVLFSQQKRVSIGKANVTGLGLDEWREITYPNAHLFNWGKNFAYDRLLDAGILTPIPVSVMYNDHENLVREEWKAYLSKLVADYSNFPNYVKGHAMFIRYRYPSHGGAYLSAASGIMRSISPFCFKEPVNFAVSLPYRWRLFYHHFFIRSLLEKGNPILAGIDIAKGGPAYPMRFTNLHKFWPLWRSILNQNIVKVSRKVIQKPINLYKQPKFDQYPLLPWRVQMAHRGNVENLFNPLSMRSGNLYRAEPLQMLVSQAEQGHCSAWSFLERVLTVEMALRATGTCID